LITWTSWCARLPRDFGVIIVAAGRGERFGSETPKQFHSVRGVPIVLRAVQCFIGHPDVAYVVLVLSAKDQAQPPAFLSEVSPATGQSFSIVPGGTHRGDSVRAGLAALGSDCTAVLIHDGARPFVDRSVIDRVISHVRRGEGACPAVPLTDTLKEVDSSDPPRILRTRPRSKLWRAQTPQGFPRKMLEAAHARAAELGRRATDDSALVEALGYTVRLVPDSTRNIKITTPEDLALAELLAGASE
jgi:2-C-methyl-D-erythritol 4-phosphate cytidylyltransferase